MTLPRVLIAGGGIGGLALALALNEIGVPFKVFENSPRLSPLGVGINLQPNAVRELDDMGFGDALLSQVGLHLKEWALVGLNGKDIHVEPRGLEAGYDWPQFSVHRGKFQIALLNELIARAGSHVVRLGSRVTGYKHKSDGTVSATIETSDGFITEEHGTLLIGADGIHSAVRAQMHPDQPPIHWGGVVMWRGTTLAKPIRTGASFVGLGTHRQRMVMYPISAADPDTGLAEINWIAETTTDTASERKRNSWFRSVEIDSFAHHFNHFRYDWLDVPALIRGAGEAFENPMIDRDRVPTWVDGPVALLGDAAHPMYPTGSNGASQAIIDARIIARKFLDMGLNPGALKAYDDDLCAPISELVLRNRGAGPFGLLQIVNSRCQGVFDDIEEVLPAAERDAFMKRYKDAAGYSRDRLNAAPRRIAKGERWDASR
ncbi:MAG: flavin-dependent oxidoreductase [Pelagimonas sp.]|uniref:flavin-dependent oxidoreductase n=1 Tax=Pelagimonas sp. TaxID=2073170 RepID=UPI003D6AF379